MPRPHRRDVAPVLGAHKWGLARCRLLECALGGLKFFAPAVIEGVVLAPLECILLQLVLWAILPIGNLTLYMQNQSLSPLYRACAAALFTSTGVVALRLGSFALGWKEATNKAITGSRRPHSRSRTKRSGARVAILPPSSEPRQTQKFLDHERPVSPTISDARENRCRAAIRFSCAPTTLDADGRRDVARRLSVGAFLSFVFIFSAAREDSAWSVSGSLSSFLRMMSWISFGMALYCVAVRHPVELAQWLTHSQVTDFALRASHVVLACVCCSLRMKPGVIAILPVLWMLGLIPCPQALVEWCLETLTLHVFGGSAASSSTRVITNFAISLVTSCLSIAFFYGFGPIGGKIAAAWLGAMLSQGVLQNARMRNADKTSFSPRMALSRRFLFSFAMCGAAGFGAYSPRISWKISICIAGGIFALQTTFSLLPFLRPRAWKARQDVAFSMANVYLLATGMFRQSVPDLSALELCSLGVLTLRNVRVASTSPQTASVEVLLAISAEGLLNSIQGPWRFVFLSYTLSIRAAAVGWLLFVAREALGNLYFMSVHTWTALREPKLRLPKGARALCIIAAPVWNPAMAVVAAVFGSPFVPVAGAGVFVAGFPRPRRLWANCLPTRGSSPEAAYYQQMLPRLLDSLVKEPAALHSASRFGSTIFLVRFEKMIAWIQILEHEAGYSIAHVKGLEMQEPTSCHNVEANHLDALIERNRGGLIVHPMCKLNVRTYSHAQVGLVGVMGSPDMAHLLHRCIGYVLAWKLVHEGKGFQQKVYELIGSETSFSAHLGGKDSTDQLESWVTFLCESRISAAASPLLELKRTWETNDFHKGPMGPIGPLGDDFDIDVLLDELDDAELSSEDNASDYDNDDSAAWLAKDALAAELAVHRQSHSREHQVSPESPHQSAVWPSSPDASHMSRTGLLPEVEKTSTKKVGSAFGSKTPFVSTSIQSREKERALPRLERSELGKCSQQAIPRTTAMPLSLPERPCDVPIACPRSPVALSSPEEILNSPIWSQDSPLPPPPPAVKTIESTKLPTGLHEAHKYGLHSRPEISTFPSGQSHEKRTGDLHAKASPTRCMGIHDSAPNRIRSMRAYDQDLHHGEKEECELRDEDPSRIAEVLKQVQNILGSEARLLSAQYALEKFRGDSALSSTFRTAVKLALDALLVGDPDPSLLDFKACATALESYTQEWFIGPEDDSNWGKAIHRECLHLLSLAERKEHQFRSGLQLLQLSLQQESASLCLVQSSVVRGIWAALAMELVFFANDDDERYSIQAHPTFLRNLIIQGAEPPLGYPVFCSGPVLIPRL